MLYKILVLSLLFLGLHADDFTCPKDKISINDGVSGSLPKGSTSMVKFAANTNCTYTFDIQKGFAIRMEISAVLDVSPGDVVRFDHFHISSGADKEVEWAVGPILNVSVVSVTGNVSFFAEYTYVDLTGYTQVIKETGSYFNSTMEANKYYTAVGAVGDTVTYNIADRQTGFFDHTIYEVFMFDGPDIVNSPYIGRLTDYLRSFNFRSDSNTLTFLNLYRTPSDTFILTNDFSKVVHLSQYNVEIVDPTAETTGFMYNALSEADSYYTFICDGCSHFYIEGLNFGNDSDASGYLEVQGMSPTQNLPYMLNYTNSPQVNMSLPQLIPSPIATFHAYKSIVEFFVKADVQSDYLALGNDRKRSVFSPKLWNTDAEQQFDYTFSDPTKVYNFSINLQSVRLQTDGDELDVQVGSVNGLTTLDKKYTKTTMTNEPLSAMGRYLHLKYSGSAASEVILTFEEIYADGPTPSTATAATKSMSTSVSQVSTSTALPSAPTTTIHVTSAPVTSTNTKVGSTPSSSKSTITQNSSALPTLATTITSSSSSSPLLTTNTTPRPSSRLASSPATSFTTPPSTATTTTKVLTSSTVEWTTSTTIPTSSTPVPSTSTKRPAIPSTASISTTMTSAMTSTPSTLKTTTFTTKTSIPTSEKYFTTTSETTIKYPTSTTTTGSMTSTTVPSTTTTVLTSPTSTSFSSEKTLTTSSSTTISPSLPTSQKISTIQTSTPQTAPSSDVPTTPLFTITPSRLPSIGPSSPLTVTSKDTTGVSTSTVHTTTSGSSSLTGLFLLVTLLSSINLL